MAQHTETLIASIMAVWVLFLLYAYFRPTKALAVLEQDWLGLVALGIGVLLATAGYSLKGDWSTFSLVFGGLIAGLGLLVILPKGLTETVIHPSNLGLIIALISVVAFVYYAILPSMKDLGPAIALVEQAFALIYSNSKATQAVALFVTPIVFAFGAFMFWKGRKS